jgi:hypothetical protein
MWTTITFNAVPIGAEVDQWIHAVITFKFTANFKDASQIKKVSFTLGG